MQTWIHYLVYSSTATRALPDEELIALLDQSRRSNALGGITGMLLYKSGRFLQVLEGDERAVQSLFGKIRSDPRHTAVRTLLVGEAEERQFPTWSMGFKNLSLESVEEIPGFSTFLSDEANWDANSPHARTAYRLLLRFREAI
jgi:hypothetical protein